MISENIRKVHGTPMCFKTIAELEAYQYAEEFEIDDIIHLLGVVSVGDGLGHARKVSLIDDTTGILLTDGRYANEVPDTRTNNKLDRGGYDGTAQDLKDEIDNKLNKGELPNLPDNLVTRDELDVEVESLKENIDFNFLATLGIEYGGILNNTNAKVSGKAYYDTIGKKLYKCIANTSINYADAIYFEAISRLVDVRLKGYQLILEI